MALIRYKTGRSVGVSASRGARLWRLWKEELEPAGPEEAAEVSTISAIYLNRENAPESYIIAREHIWDDSINRQPDLFHQRKDLE
jgi:hypothetical protein